VLKRLHALGVKHGDVNKHNFLITDREEAVMVDFETAVKCQAEEELIVEYDGLQQELVGNDGRGGLVEKSDGSSE
jgi:tRNA A-37 threonylcarbamoyl transferase component Bud32